MLQHIVSIQAVLKSGDKAQARRLLAPLLDRSPTADLWYLASQASETPEDELKCLNRALALDPMHGKSRTRLFELRQPSLEAKPASPINPTPQKPAEPPPLDAPAPKPKRERTSRATAEVDVSTLKKAYPPRKRSAWRTLGCLGFILLSLASSFFVMSVLGMGLAGRIVVLFGGAQPITEIDGVPIEDVAHAPLLVPANRSVPLDSGQQQVDILYPGYAHEYSFPARAGQEMTIYVQFLSPTAKNVSPNVAVVDPTGADAEGYCTRGGILTDNSGVTFVCQVHESGNWKVRIFGREGESSGAYYVSAQELEF